MDVVPAVAFGDHCRAIRHRGLDPTFLQNPSVHPFLSVPWANFSLPGVNVFIHDTNADRNKIANTSPGKLFQLFMLANQRQPETLGFFLSFCQKNASRLATGSVLFNVIHT